MDLFEHETEETMSREAAADKLRELADMLSRHNEVAFRREGLKYTVKVPSQVTIGLEIDIEGDGGEIEVEIRW